MRKIPDISFPTSVILFLIVLVSLIVIFPRFFLENLLAIVLGGIIILILIRAFHVSLLTIIVFSLLGHLFVGGLLYTHLLIEGKAPDNAIDYIVKAHIRETEAMINEGIESYNNPDPMKQAEARYKLFIGSFSEFPILIFLWMTTHQLTFILRRERRIEFEGTDYVQARRPRILPNLLSLAIAIAIMGFILQPLSGTYVPGIVRIMLLMF